MENVTRRQFVAGTAVGAAVACSAAMSRAASADASGSESFDASYDVVVVGYGFAGAAAALYAADAGAKVLVVDAAPQGEEGGNSRFCAQVCAYSTDKDSMLAYYKALGWKFDQDEGVLEAFVDGLAEIPEIFERMGAADRIVVGDFLETEAGQNTDDPAVKVLRALRAYGTPEYPELPGGEAIDSVTAHVGARDGFFYQCAQEAVEAEEGVEVWLESPARSLVFDSEEHRVTGVVVEHDGKALRVEAAKGVVLASGGFECNTQMVQDYLGVPYLAPVGGMHNNGDGIRMAQQVGADLWHMSVYESMGMLGGNEYAVPQGERAIYITSGKFVKCVAGALVCVADDGSRFLREDLTERHGHLYSHGVWKVPNIASTPHMVFDAAEKAVLEEAGCLPDGVDDKLLSAETAEELAEAMGVDAEIFARTISRFNSYAENGEDLEYDRAPESMKPFEGTLYALPLQPTVLNTQGGPRRNAQAQVISVTGNPIAGLFSAGECGGICTFNYQGASNVAECIVFGRIAGTNAAQGVA